jgi:hypothetical protein
VFWHTLSLPICFAPLRLPLLAVRYLPRHTHSRAGGLIVSHLIRQHGGVRGIRSNGSRWSCKAHENEVHCSHSARAQYQGKHRDVSDYHVLGVAVGPWRVATLHICLTSMSVQHRDEGKIRETIEWLVTLRGSKMEGITRIHRLRNVCLSA